MEFCSFCMLPFGVKEMESAKEDFEAKTEAEEFSGVIGGDDFSVDELLDFSNGYSETEEKLTEEQREAEEGKLETTSLLQERNGAVSLSMREEFGSLDEGELCFEVNLNFTIYGFFFFFSGIVLWRWNINGGF